MLCISVVQHRNSNILFFTVSDPGKKNSDSISSIKTQKHMESPIVTAC